MSKKILFIYLSLISTTVLLSEKTAMADYCPEGKCGTCTCYWIPDPLYPEVGVQCDQIDSNEWCKDSGRCERFCNKSENCRTAHPVHHSCHPKSE